MTDADTPEPTDVSGTKTVSLHGDMPKNTAIARDLIQQTASFDAAEFTDQVYLQRGDHSGYWVVWVDGAPLDTIQCSSFESATLLEGHIYELARRWRAVDPDPDSDENPIHTPDSADSRGYH